MRWQKLGRVFVPDGSRSWMRTHAANPIADRLEGSRYRIYFGARDALNRTSIAYCEINLGAPQRILALSEKPLLAPGVPGTFDDSGCSIGSIVAVGEERWLYYFGWNLGTVAPWRLAIGVASGAPRDETFRRFSDGPIMDRCPEDPYSIAYPMVLKEGSLFRMWYCATTAPGRTPEEMRQAIKYAESEDGIRWKRSREVILPLAGGTEYALSRPWVVKKSDGSGYRMFFCHRGDRYRMGYADSADGIVWSRSNQSAGIDVSPEGWDSGMVSYPCLFRHEGQVFMLYNGNHYGETGFGLAVLEGATL